MQMAFLKGFATSAALIIAIGAQNAFVLRCTPSHSRRATTRR